MTSSAFRVALATSLAVPTVLAAQVSEAVSASMPSRYVAPTCEIKPGHFKVSSGVTYLIGAQGGNGQVSGAGDPEKRRNLRNSGIRVVTEAITENNQAGNGAAWYYLGRLHLDGGDLVGADSAFTKAAELAPQCAEDIRSWRQRAWLVLMNPAAEYVRQDKGDSALALFRQAAIISRDFPQGFYNMGVLYANGNEPDSAAKYFEISKQRAATDPARFAKDRNAAAFNLAAMYQRAGKHDAAITELRAYIGWEPGDVEAKRALATSLRAVGKTDEATALDKEALQTMAASGDLTSSDVMTMGINAFNDKKYEEAAQQFAKVLETEPWNRDARYNLANAYLALQDGPKLVETAAPIVENEPLNEDARKLLSQGYRIQGNNDKLIETATALVAMPTGLQGVRLAVGTDGARLTGTAYGRAAQTLEGKAIPAKAQTMVIEFLGKDGAVIATSEVALPALAAEATHDFTAEATGAGIVGWRYKVK
ncbi:MAG TPA: tetratricopeptide repeat protein [Gemmatimonadales bacterium]|nr:tetratricopeptide repeat protein [Gemmatimonadales bacterium]